MNDAYFLIILIKNKEMSQNSYFLMIYSHVYQQQKWIVLEIDNFFTNIKLNEWFRYSKK